VSGYAEGVASGEPRSDSASAIRDRAVCSRPNHAPGAINAATSGRIASAAALTANRSGRRTGSRRPRRCRGTPRGRILRFVFFRAARRRRRPEGLGEARWGGDHAPRGLGRATRTFHEPSFGETRQHVAESLRDSHSGLSSVESERSTRRRRKGRSGSRRKSATWATLSESCLRLRRGWLAPKLGGRLQGGGCWVGARWVRLSERVGYGWRGAARCGLGGVPGDGTRCARPLDGVAIT
jgi:hypothetical protein